MLSLTPRPKEPQRAQTSTVSTFERVVSYASEIYTLQIVGSRRFLISVCSVSSDKLEPDDDCLKYLPGKARSHHLEMMMSTEELEEEQRSVKTTNMAATL